MNSNTLFSSLKALSRVLVQVRLSGEVSFPSAGDRASRSKWDSCREPARRLANFFE